MLTGGGVLYNADMTVYSLVPPAAHQFPNHPKQPARLDLPTPRLASFQADISERIEQVRQWHGF